MNFFSKYKPHLYQQGNVWYIRKWVMGEGWNYLDNNGYPHWWGTPQYIKDHCRFTSEEAARNSLPKVTKL